MRHFFAKLSVVTAAVLGGALLTACTQSAGIGNAKIRLALSDETRVVVEVTAGDLTHSLYDALASLAEKGDIRMEGSSSDYGFYLTSVNGMAADESNYWAVYTTLGTLDDIVYSDTAYGTWEYEGRTLAMAACGVSGLLLVEGEWYALVWTPYEQNGE